MNKEENESRLSSIYSERSKQTGVCPSSTGGGKKKSSFTLEVWGRDCHGVTLRIFMCKFQPWPKLCTLLFHQRLREGSQNIPASTSLWTLHNSTPPHPHAATITIPEPFPLKALILRSCFTAGGPGRWRRRRRRSQSASEIRWEEPQEDLSRYTNTNISVSLH